MSKKNKYIIGKCNYEGKGNVNIAEVEWELKDGNFSAMGGIWNTASGSKKDYISGGQILDELLSLFPDDQLLSRIHSVWKKWHLNDLIAGSARQEAFLAGKTAPSSDHYQWATETLAAAGLNPDTEYLREGKPYQYGSAWLSSEIPPAIISEIESWSHEPGVNSN
jgi:hypothetical protein